MNTFDKLCNSLTLTYPETTFANATNGENFADFEWVDNPITEVEFNGVITSKSYILDRAEAYPPIEDQLDDIYHNGVAGWKKTIQAVKDTYPKP